MHDQLEFVDLWYVMILVNDVLTIIGSILKIMIETKVRVSILAFTRTAAGEGSTSARQW